MKPVIYSNATVKGLEGVYASPDLFDGDTEYCVLFYTDDAKIKKAYEAKGIKVEPIKKSQPKPKKETTEK